MNCLDSITSDRRAGHSVSPNAWVHGHLSEWSSTYIGLPTLNVLRTTIMQFIEAYIPANYILWPPYSRHGYPRKTLPLNTRTHPVQPKSILQGAYGRELYTTATDHYEYAHRVTILSNYQRLGNSERMTKIAQLVDIRKKVPPHDKLQSVPAKRSKTLKLHW